jgi:DNA-binding NarL/FixJ family response regulator
MIRLLIVGPVRLYRDGLSYILHRTDGFAIVAARSNSEDLASDIDELAPDVVLVDMAGDSDCTIARDLRRHLPATPIVAIGVEDSEPRLLACAEAGVFGYVTREASVETLIATITSVARGELLCSPSTAGALARRLATLADARTIESAPQRLTIREHQIAFLIREDLSNKEIATRLGIEVATVKNHVHNLLEKLNVRRRADVRRAVLPATLRKKIASA